MAEEEGGDEQRTDNNKEQSVKVRGSERKNRQLRKTSLETEVKILVGLYKSYCVTK